MEDSMKIYEIISRQTGAIPVSCMRHRLSKGMMDNKKHEVVTTWRNVL